METKFDSDTFVRTALEDGEAARDLFSLHPGLRDSSFYASLVIGDAEAVEAALTENPGLANAKGGPCDWQPLLYVCFSRMGSAGSAETAEVLLQHGADPNVSYNSAECPDNPLSCLYGATGLNNDPELAKVLLEAGAEPDDSESLYHSTEHADLECLKLLLDHKASTVGGNILKHMLDREDSEGVRLLLDAGADPNETNPRGETALHWAVWRGRSAEVVEALLESGAAIDAKRMDGRTAYMLAVQGGHTEVAALLKTSGASTELPAIDAFLAACERADAGELEDLIRKAQTLPHTDADERLLPDYASAHRTKAVRALLAMGLPVDARGEFGETGLHWACWRGYADVAATLLERGASLSNKDKQFHATPVGWFAHGLRNCGDNRGDYGAVARVLIGAKAEIPVEEVRGADPGVDAVLNEHGLLP